MWYIGVAWQAAEQLKTWDLRKLGNIRKSSKSHRTIAHSPVPQPKQKPRWNPQYQKKSPEKQKSNAPCCSPHHTKTRASSTYTATHCSHPAKKFIKFTQETHVRNHYQQTLSCRPVAPRHGTRLRHRHIPTNFATTLRTPFFIEYLR